MSGRRKRKFREDILSIYTRARAERDTRKPRRILPKLAENLSGRYEMYPEESPLVYAAFIQIRNERTFVDPRESLPPRRVSSKVFGVVGLPPVAFARGEMGGNGP